LNISLDLALIPHYGAVGAAVGNGVSQSAAVLALLWVTERNCEVRLPWAALVKNLVVAFLMGGVVYLAVKPLPPVGAVAAGPVLGAAIYLVLVRTFGLVSSDDAAAFAAIGSKLPHSLQQYFLTILNWLANPEAHTAREVSFAPRTGSAGS
jgi:O-antigen/teichoic acid export membrane protein